MILHPGKYITNGDMSAASITGRWIDCRALKRLSLDLNWTGVSAPTGTFQVEGTDDPTAERENDGGPAVPAANRRAMKLPSDGVHLSGAATHPGAAGSTDIDTTGAGEASINVENPLAFHRLVYTRTGGGDATGLQARASGRG